jgi:hypothetical protein
LRSANDSDSEQYREDCLMLTLHSTYLELNNYQKIAPADAFPPAQQGLKPACAD